MHALILVASGALFAVGLAISGMTQPTKVVGFLDFFGSWDASLMFVMGGAIAVNFVAMRFILRRPGPVFGTSFSLPTRKDLDPRLIGGAALFGVGWGLGGFCPGPALVSLATASTPVLVFVSAMLAGMVGFDLFDQAQARKAKS